MMLCHFVKESNKKDIFNDFPLSEQAKILDRFVWDPYFYGWNVNNAVVLMVYILWSNYINKDSNWKNHNLTYPMILYLIIYIR